MSFARRSFNDLIASSLSRAELLSTSSMPAASASRIALLMSDATPAAPDATTLNPSLAVELPKGYAPAQAEPVVHARWKAAGCFHADPASDGESFAIFIPPPNVTAALHLGHAFNNSLQDLLTRYHRMRGCNTMWMPGTDHAGIATQTVVEKRLLLQGKRRTDFTREAFVEKVQEWKDEYEATILSQLDSMGCSCDFARTRFTMDETCAAAVRAAFFQLFADGLVYRGKRLVNWDPVSQTALADDEVEMEEIDGNFYYLRYPFSDGSGHITVATTRPETMLGDSGVGINPKDPRAASLRGKTLTLPIVGRIIPIVEDDYVVMPASMGGDPADAKALFATGFLKVTPAHDQNDWELGLRHNLAAINIMAPDGSISDAHGWNDVSAEARAFVGLSREDARKRIVAWFKANGLLEEIKPYRHSVGHSYRSHVPVEPYLSDQWYVRVTDDALRGSALRAMVPDQIEGTLSAEVTRASAMAGDGELRFFPARYAKSFQSWHENLRDWCISRQLWWGHRIPVWSKRGAGSALATHLGMLSSLPSSSASVGATRVSDGQIVAISMLASSHAEFDLHVCLASDSDGAMLERAGFARDPDVLDTWFSSALWPMSTLGWPEVARWPDMEGMLERYNPSSVLCTAREIITLWVSRMVMFNRYFLGRLPFRDVFIHAMIQDGHGQKMSKSLGNGVDPRDIIHSHGCDAMRFTLVGMATNTQDVRLSVDLVDPYSGETFAPKWTTASGGYTVADAIQTSPKDPSKKMVTGYGVAMGLVTATAEMPLARNTSSRFDLGRNFANKLWNATRFALANLAAAAPDSKAEPLTLLDSWMLARLEHATRTIDKAIADYEFHRVAEALYDLVWRDFCDWYLEGVKPTIRNNATQQAILAATLDAIVRLLHPVCPFVTETLWESVQAMRKTHVAGLELPSNDLCTTAAWPVISSSLRDEKALAEFARMQTLVELIRRVRGERQVSPKRKIVLHADDALRALVTRAAGVIETLAGIERVETICAVRPLGAVAIAFEGSELLIDGLVDAVDATAEKSRLIKLIADRNKQATGMRAKLENEAYLARAPVALVDETKKKLAELEAEIAAAERAMADLG
ncbi:MAG: valine--tRNA ligase [Planctomycetota bacterium]|nr:MAG: valine--tRNA ligase [Planctomycetota bacterium]RLS95535.1 MAG: valine--tRNA ligase [Planctomycetota bacterium]